MLVIKFKERKLRKLDRQERGAGTGGNFSLSGHGTLQYTVTFQQSPEGNEGSATCTAAQGRSRQRRRGGKGLDGCVPGRLRDGVKASAAGADHALGEEQKREAGTTGRDAILPLCYCLLGLALSLSPDKKIRTTANPCFPGWL